MLEIARHENLSRAARELHLSAPALSAALRRVEKYLGHSIFERTNHGMHLTIEGERLLPYLERVSTAVADLHIGAATNPNLEPLGRPVKVGMVFGYGSVAIQEIIAAGVRIEVAIFGWEDCTAGLASGTTDLGILAGPTDHDRHFEWKHVGDEPFKAVVSTQLPVAKQASVTLAELDEIGWLYPADRPDASWTAFHLHEHIRGFPPRRGRHGPVNSAMELAMAVHNGEGTVTTIGNIHETFSLGGDVAVPVEDVPPAPVRVAYRSGTYRPEYEAIIVELAKRLPPPNGGQAVLRPS